jgi:hypothetical protein
VLIGWRINCLYPSRPRMVFPTRTPRAHVLPSPTFLMPVTQPACFWLHLLLAFGLLTRPSTLRQMSTLLRRNAANALTGYISSGFSHLNLNIIFEENKLDPTRFCVLLCCSLVRVPKSSSLLMDSCFTLLYNPRSSSLNAHFIQHTKDPRGWLWCKRARNAATRLRMSCCVSAFHTQQRSKRLSYETFYIIAYWAGQHTAYLACCTVCGVFLLKRTAYIHPWRPCLRPHRCVFVFPDLPLHISFFLCVFI